MELPAPLFTEYHQSINPKATNTPQNDDAPNNTLENTSKSLQEPNYTAYNTWEYPMLCYNCGTYSSPVWSTDANGYSLCNFCCYHRKHASIERPYTKTKRLTNLKDSKTCFNCQTDKTTLWRRNNEGERVCNSCGLYFKMHGFNRPPSMRKDTIQTRKRKPKNVRSGNDYQPTPLANFNGFDPASAPYFLNTSTAPHRIPIYVSSDALTFNYAAANPPPPYYSSIAPETPANNVNPENI